MTEDEQAKLQKEVEDLREQVQRLQRVGTWSVAGLVILMFALLSRDFVESVLALLFVVGFAHWCSTNAMSKIRKRYPADNNGQPSDEPNGAAPRRLS